MTQLLEYGEIKLIDASSAPFRVPPHYVQLVASSTSALESSIDSSRMNSDSPLKPSPIKTEPTALIKPQPTPTDFENLIEMNSRKQNLDSTAEIAAATATANKIIKFEPKTIANTSVVASTPGNMSISSTSASPFSSIKAQNGALKVKPSNGVQQMDVDDVSIIGPNPNHLPSPKYALGMDNKLINKVKIVVDNMNNGAALATKHHRLDLDASGYLMPHPHASLMAAAAAAQQAAFPGYNFHSSFQLYEYSQNNQNFLNQHRVDAEHHNGIDDSMWRPW